MFFLQIIWYGENKPARYPTPLGHIPVNASIYADACVEFSGMHKLNWYDIVLEWIEYHLVE